MNEDSSFQFFLQFYADLERQGPGDDRITRNILNLLTDLPQNPETIDMGCGSGAQTVVLAESGCRVTAVDLYPDMVDQLQERTQQRGLSGKVTPLCASMDAYAPKSPVDLIWSEGAVYIIGFENGLRLWHQHLKKGGYLVVSELTWLIDLPPERLREYWEKEYPAMQTVVQNQEIIKRAGYRFVGSVLLPDAAWDAFHSPQKEKISRLRASGSLKPEEEEVLSSIEYEISIFEEFRGLCGYVFYLMQKVS